MNLSLSIYIHSTKLKFNLPVNVSFEKSNPWGHRNIDRSTDNLLSSFAGVGHSLDVVEQDVGPVDALGVDVDADAGSFVDGVSHDGGQVGSIHSGSEDSVVVGDEHEPHGRVESDVDGARQVGGEDDGVVGSLEVENVDLLAEPVNDVEDVADPVDGDGNRGPAKKKSIY